jgi:hypothetical protein
MNTEQTGGQMRPTGRLVVQKIPALGSESEQAEVIRVADSEAQSTAADLLNDGTVR